MRRLTAIVATCAVALGSLGLDTTLTASAAPADPLQQMSSQLGSSRGGSSHNDALKNAYRALPKEIRNNPVINKGARDLGLVAPTAPAAQPAAPRTSPRPPARTPGPAPQRGCPNCVALTYDDGPASDTNRLLDILDANNVNASFFLLAPKVNANPGIVRRMKSAGHTVGNHSVSHPELNKLSVAQVDAEIAGGSAAIRRATGSTPRWFRPPYGATNATVNAEIGKAGQAVALWSIDTEDWRTKDSANTCRVTVSQARPGSIVLMHDVHASSVAAAQCIIDGLRAKGLEPVSLDEMIPNPRAGWVYYNR